ncbi:MAG: mobile mystery protein A [Pseudomonadota bacterium]
MDRKKLIREQLDASLSRFGPLRDTPPPQKGWIRAIRAALGMSARQLAARMGITQQSVARIEKEETAGAVTIKTLRRVAEGLDCMFVYGFVPKTSLNENVRRQARRVAHARMARVAHTMDLERQGLSDEEKDKVLIDTIDEIIRTMPPSLWEKP